MPEELTYTKLYIEYLRTNPIVNQFFDISFERLHTTSGSIVFQRKTNGQLVKCKFVIKRHLRQPAIDITLILWKHRFKYIANGILVTSPFITSETELFQERMDDLLDIID
jgi:hypothetical protein